MPYNPDTRQRIERATRFFARMVSFDLECPHCGKVYTIRATNNRGQGRGDLDVWDPVTARFTCNNQPRCQHRVYVLGILAWPVAHTPAVASQTPRDQTPHPRQLAQMRKEAGGWWLPPEERITEKRPSETNLTLEPERPEENADDDDEI